MICLKQGGTLFLLALLSLPCRLYAAPVSFDLDLKELDRHEPASEVKPAKKKTQRAKKSRSPRGEAGGLHGAAESSEPVRYTVRPGDHIFKILIVHFGMSNEAAERLVPEIARLNNIANIKRLTVGQVLLIPATGEDARRAKPSGKGGGSAGEAATAAAKAPEQSAGAQVKAPAAKANVPAAQTASSETPMAPVPPRTVPVVAVPAAPPPAHAEPVTTHGAGQAAAAQAEVPRVRETPAAPELPLASTWICAVTEKDAPKIVDTVLNALSISWSRNRIVQSNDASPTAFSIRVDRYFEYKDARYIVSIGESDPYSYTLIRILESAGYRVLRITGREDFDTVCRKLLGLIGLAPDFGRQELAGGKGLAGFLVQQEDAAGRQVFITGEPVDQHRKWVLAPGCGVR